MDAERLVAIHSILHLLFHRNKNQHSNTTWWKWLAILKRTTRKLAISVEHQPSHTANQSSAKHKKHLAHNIIPRCYVVFSTVVADGQFSTLGTVLLATLARLAKAIEIRQELKYFATAAWTASALGHSSETTNEEDVGTVISRTRHNSGLSVRPDLHSSVDQGHMVKQKSTNKLSSNLEDYEETISKEQNQKNKRNKTKKRKGKDAIDDLFDSLL